MFKNTAGQKIRVFAMDYSTGAPKTGDAANLTLYISKDYAAAAALTDTSATEVSSTNAPGWYEFDVSQTETNADDLQFMGKSSTANVAVVGRNVRTLPVNFTTLAIDSGGRTSANVTQFGGTNGTFAAGRPEVNTTHFGGTAATTSAGRPEVNSTHFAGQAITAAAPVTIPASIASPTNITAGTITTCTNLTNAPTAGDLTATMKASVATAALTTQVTEAYRADGAAPTLAQALCELLAHAGEKSIAATTLTLKKFDGTTTAATFTLNDGTTPTAITRAS